MGAWRGVVLLCSLWLGCGGPGEETPVPGEDVPQETPPAEGAGDRTGTPSPGTPSPGTPSPGTPSPGTPSSPTFGTARLVADLLPPSDDIPRLMSGPEDLVGFQGRLYFTTPAQGTAGTLWRTDGTQAGTTPVKEFSAGVLGPTVVGNQLFFVALETGQSPGLWVTDGTSGGTRRVKEFASSTGWDSAPYRLTALGGRLLFFRYQPADGNGTNRTELWTSDGTDAGTQRVRELGPESSLSTMQTRVGNTLYFVLTDAAHGTELWRTDGTPTGTALVKDIQPGPQSAYPSDFEVLGTSVFFLTSTPTQGRELWRTDGSETGTVRVRELSKNFDGPTSYLLPGTGNQVFLALSTPSDHLLHLSSLTLSGGGVQEQAVATLPNAYANQDGSDPTVGEARVAGGKVFFSQYISSSGPAPRDVQLWVTDGTKAGTLQVSRPLSLSDEFQSELFALDERLLYSNIAEGYGLEPWVSDGTVAGTRMVQDIAPGKDSSFPRHYTRVGNAVYFTAYTPAHGNELWVLPLGK